MKAFRKICFYLSTILCIVCFLFPQKGKAEGTVSLTVELIADGAALPGAEFKIYRIGSHIDAEGGITLAEPFASEFTITLDNVTDWDDLAVDIAAYIDAHGIPYTDARTTDANGKAVFPSSGGLPEGLYFVSAASVESGNKIYTTLPFIILLPAWDKESECWVYDVTAQPKIGVEEPTPTPTATPTPTPTPTGTGAPTPTPTPTPSPLPGTGVEWRPTFWLSGFGVFFLLLSIVTGILAFRKKKTEE